MIERNGRSFLIVCDGSACGDEIEVDSPDWGDVMRALRDNNWQASKVGSIWEHHCPTCCEEADEHERKTTHDLFADDINKDHVS